MDQKAHYDWMTECAKENLRKALAQQSASLEERVRYKENARFFLNAARENRVRNQADREKE